MDPIDPSQRFQILRILLLQHNYREALLRVVRFLEEDPTNPKLLRVYIEVCIHVGKVNEAQEALARMVRSQPEPTDLALAQGQILLAKGDHSQAARHFQEGLSHQPQNVQLRQALAWMYLKSGNFPLAMRWSENVLELDPANSAAHTTRAWAQIKLGDPANGLNGMREALRHEPNRREIHANLGWMLLELGDYTAAEDQLRRSLAGGGGVESENGLRIARRAGYRFYRPFLRAGFYWARHPKYFLLAANTLLLLTWSVLGWLCYHGTDLRIVVPLFCMLSLPVVYWWGALPLSTALLLFDPVVKRTLTTLDKIGKLLLLGGISLAAGTLIAYCFSGEPILLMTCFFALTLSAVGNLAITFLLEKEGAKTLVLWQFGVAVATVLSYYIQPPYLWMIFFFVYVAIFFLAQWPLPLAATRR